ncbi:MAG: MarR family transcriptional regulator [Chloroflexi bacterium]|nr:MarR family transcriptional regulator [Chloroflexota bacterium]
MEDFNIDQGLGYIVAKTNWYMKTYFTKMIRDNSLNVTPEQWAVLNALDRHPRVSQTQLAQISLKDKTTVTRILDVLERNGYIQRNRDEHDRRMYRISLTKEGKNVLEQLIPIADGANQVCGKDLEKDELHQLTRSLNTVCQTIEKLLSEIGGK